MSMYTAIQNSAEQFSFNPDIVNAEKLRSASRYVLVGMGGSHLAADLLKIAKPDLDMVVHRGYGLPSLTPEDMSERLIISSSYSGNTEEVLDAYKKAGELGLNRAVLSIGGTLIERAKKDSVPYIQMPDSGIQPRSALALNLKGLLKLIGEESMLKKISTLAQSFRPRDLEEEGKQLAELLRDHVPVIYASEKNQSLAYNWKIKFNETGKIPAFYNTFSELNHNEMTGFDVKDSTRTLSEKFVFIFIRDPDDHPQIKKRMDVTATLYRDRKLRTHDIKLSGDSVFHAIFNTLTIADFAAYFTAEGYGLESEQVPMVEEFKKLIARD